jgi:diketogulonate reductase-like aldo/keto reductase
VFTQFSFQRLEENLAALNVKLSSEEVKEIREATEKAGANKVPRHPAAFKSMHYIDTPPLK